MTFYPGRYAKWLCVLLSAVAVLVIGVTAGVVSLPSPVTAKAGMLASGDTADSVTAEAEQATLAGPVTIGKSIGGVGYVRFGSTAPDSGFQPAAPYFATFYYPWYGAPTPDGQWSYWNGQGSQPPSTWFSHYLPDPLPNGFDPSRELYSSHDANLLPALEAGTGTTAARAAVAGISAAPVVTATPGSFSFAVAGDLGGGSAATASLQALGGSGADFFLGIGDMSYDDIKPEAAWCSYVQQYVGATYPFELLVGNHEEQPSGPNGFIDNFAACLPDHLGVNGLYAHQYYFDYPPAAPLARFILIDPDLYRGATVQQYCTGGETENCDWLKARIDEAKSQGLWTIVGMHKNCLTIGQKSCEIGADLLNMLIERKVDLVLQGHDHGYQRSKQLGLGASCPAVKARAYNPACVVDGGADGSYGRGAGLVFIISAAFGRSSYAVNPTDPEAGYMATWMDTGARSNGFLQLTVTKDTIDGQYVNARGPFTDHLTISTTAVPPTPTPEITPTPGGTVPPTQTPVATVTPEPCPAPSGDMGVATLNVDFPAAGTYYIWSRMLAANSAQGAFWMEIDDTCALRVIGGQAGSGGWEWVNDQDGAPGSPMQEQIAAGAHVVRLYGIDAGVKVDKLLFTTDPNPQPLLLPPAGVEAPLFLPLVHS